MFHLCNHKNTSPNIQFETILNYFLDKSFDAYTTSKDNLLRRCHRKKMSNSNFTQESYLHSLISHPISIFTISLYKVALSTLMSKPFFHIN